ncbi:MAG: hypothetical protein F6J93_38285 [Oscillatoria sp. SIO1A7]|nr:hypothetical protein [Oscillatoria sp. SIO1A7]
MDLNVFSTALTAVVVGFLAIGGCASQPKVKVTETPRTVQLHQSWEVQPGDDVAGHLIAGGLGDVAIALQGSQNLYAPVSGRLQPHSPGCAIFSSEELPIYLFRFCGLKDPKWGQRRAGEMLGKAEFLNVAVLNRRKDGKWAFVEPSKQILENILKPLQISSF